MGWKFHLCGADLAMMRHVDLILPRIEGFGATGPEGFDNMASIALTPGARGDLPSPSARHPAERKNPGAFAPGFLL